MKRSSVSCFVHILCLILVFLVLDVSSKECGDPECKTVISTGKTVIRYRGGGGQKVNLDQNESLEILAKNIGKEQDYWVRKANGKEGLVAKHFVRENAILIKATDRITLSDEPPPQDIPGINVAQPADSAAAAAAAGQTTVIQGTAFASEVNSVNPTAHVTFTEASVTVQPTPTLEIIPSTQPVSSVQPIAATQSDERVDEVIYEETSELDDDDDEDGDEDDNSEEEDVGTEGNEDTERSKNELFNQEDVTTNTDPVRIGSADFDTDLNSVKKAEAVDLMVEGAKKEHSTTTNEILLKDAQYDEKAEADTISAQPVQDTTNNQDVVTKARSEEKKTVEMVVKEEQQLHENIPSQAHVDQELETTSPNNLDILPDVQVVQQSSQANVEILTTEYVEKKETDSNANNKDSIDSSGMVDSYNASSSEDLFLAGLNMPSDDNLTLETISNETSSILTSDLTVVDISTTPPSVQETTSSATVASSKADIREPAPVSEMHQVEATNAPQLSKSENQPTQPNRILSGGLGNLLANSHHHHHHPHQHQHQHQHHTPSQKMEDVQKAIQEDTETESVEPEETLQNSEPRPSERLIESTHIHSGDHESVEYDKIANLVQVPVENEYCDNSVSDCPPATSSVPTSILQSNGKGGFQHPLVNNHQLPMGESVRRNEGEIEQLQDPLKERTDDFLEVQAPPFGDYVTAFVREAIKLSDLILMLAITSFTLLVFSLGHYLISKNRCEKPLIYKLNMVERDLMTSYKENTMLKNELQDTKHKLVSIENNSFGSNDMVIALRTELEAAESMKLELQDQIAGLEKELENAAEAGLELNKMVAELLNQNGSDSIALSVEELQRQLNEQQQTILSMNSSLAEKSRENSDLQITIASQTSKFSELLKELENARNELNEHRTALQDETTRLQFEQQTKVESLRRESSIAIDRLTKELKVAHAKTDEGRKAYATVEAKCEALEECLKEIKLVGSGGTGKAIIDSVELKAKIALLANEKANIQEKLQGEMIARQLIEDHMKMVNEEISSLKRDFGKAEKDKLEAETRLEVLSSYFKEKESQLQKELSVKEAMWMQQQGETITTVEKIRQMQDEIQQLKSQNDKLRVEIEAQATAHKAQYTTLETRSHDAWLAARQAERRLEEARVESTALRRKLTSLGDVSAISDGMIHLPNTSMKQTDLGLTAPSPIRVESPNAPLSLMSVLPPPPFMPPFMPGPPPPFMPPFMPPPHGPGEMRPPPLGRLMSPPPPAGNRYSPNSIIDARERYSPDRGRYSPDSRYDYSVMSTYETENDFSPPPSPPRHPYHSRHDRERERDRERKRDLERERDRDRDIRERDRDRDHRDGRTSGNGGYPRGFTPTGIRTSPPIQDPRNKKFAGTNCSRNSEDELDEW